MIKLISIISLAFLGFACAQHPEKPLSQPQNSNNAEQITQAPAPVVNNESGLEASMLSEEDAAEAIASAESQIAALEENEADQLIEDGPDFMETVQEQALAVFLSAKSKSGRSLSIDQAEQLTAAFMPVVEAAQSKKAIRTAQAWNNFVKTIEEMNQQAQVNAAANGVAVQDIAGLVVDAIGLCIDLIAAVANLDIAGIIAVILDAVDLIIDFLA